MVVHQPIAFWENWSRQRFESSGAYPIEGALAPVKATSIAGPALTEEPNVWVSYGI